MTQHQQNFPSLTQNETRLLGLVFRHERLTQAQLTTKLNIKQQSVSRIVNGLIEQGLLTAGERISSGSRGQPSLSVSLATEFAYTFGISIMNDAVSIAMMDFAGNVLEETKEAFNSMSRERITSWVKQTIQDMSSRVISDPSRVYGIGVGIPGSFVGEGVGFNTPHQLDEWALVDIKKLLSEELKLPVWVDNDGNAAALGESMAGVGRWANSFAYLYMASGVGGGLILNGELWRGRHGNAGEFAGGLPNNIYPFPNLELLRQLISQQGPKLDTVNDLVENFRTDWDWPAIEDWITRIRDSLSIIVSNATAILDLDAVVLGGRLPKALAERIIPRIEFFDQKRRSVLRPTAKLVPAETSGDATAIGAAMLPLKYNFFA